MFTISHRELHDEGLFPGTITAWEEAEGQYGTQIKWTITTNLYREDSSPHSLSFYTSTRFSTDPRSRLKWLLDALGIPIPQTAEDAQQFNPDNLMGKKLRVTVVHKRDADGSVWANIAGLSPASQTRPRTAASAPNTTQPAHTDPPPSRQATARKAYERTEAMLVAAGADPLPWNDAWTPEEIEAVLKVRLAELAELTQDPFAEE